MYCTESKEQAWEFSGFYLISVILPVAKFRKLGENLNLIDQINPFSCNFKKSQVILVEHILSCLKEAMAIFLGIPVSKITDDDTIIFDTQS